jgi:Tfp pilus assembly protein PilO
MIAFTGLDRSAKIVLGTALGGLLVLTLAVWFLFISPKRSQAADLRAEVAVAQQQLDARSSQQLPLAGVSAAEVRALERAMPDSAQTSSLVRQLDRLARRAGVTLDTVTPQAETGGAGYKSIPLAVVVDGKFFGIRKFLRLLRKQVQLRGGTVHGTGRLFDVQAIDLQQSDDPRPDVRATLTMQAFLYSGGAGTPTTPATDATAAAGAAGAGG